MLCLLIFVNICNTEWIFFKGVSLIFLLPRSTKSRHDGARRPSQARLLSCLGICCQFFFLQNIIFIECVNFLQEIENCCQIAGNLRLDLPIDYFSIP